MLPKGGTYSRRFVRLSVRYRVRQITLNLLYLNETWFIDTVDDNEGKGRTQEP